MVNSMILVNEGNHKHGELDGIAKNYYQGNGKLMFEGSFNNGKRHGTGKYYDPLNNSVLVYEGEYVNGVREGDGKLFYGNGQIEFEGEFVDGSPNPENGQYYTENGEAYMVVNIDDTLYRFIPTY